MKIAIIGTGYVGLVTGTCLAELGNQVTCVDIDRGKIAKLQKGIIPIYEPGLEELVRNNSRLKRLAFTDNFKTTVTSAKVIIIAVGTPPKKNGSADLKVIKAVSKKIGRNIKNYKIIVIKSTVPVGTSKLVSRIIKEYYHGKFAIVSCPEFLREGSAIDDFMNPDRIVIGSDDAKAKRIMLELFRSLPGEKLCFDLETAELVKYASNAFLATKISFINEIANVCEKVGADVEQVAIGMGLDKRIGPKFLRAGLGYGGSCFPKDVRALKQIAAGRKYDFKLLKAVIGVNNQQRRLLLKKIKTALGSIKNKRIGILGLAFKSNTDDVRESAAIEIIKQLVKLGGKISTYDPVALNNAKKVLPPQVEFYNNPYDALTDCHLIVITTEWLEFKNLDWLKIKKISKAKCIIDGKNLLNGERVNNLGFRYLSIGRRPLK